MKSRVYKSHGINACWVRGKVDTLSAIKVYLNKCGVRGMSVTTIYSDNEFARTLEENVGGELDGIHRSTRSKNPVRDYEPSFGGNTYVQQMFNVRHTKDRGR